MFDKTLRPLSGHTSPETAYVVDDYPYGFRLRCKIRYWLEYNVKHGFRLCSQTTNPKVAGERWNKPKCSTYSTLAVLGLDAEDHVTWTGINYNAEDLDAFKEEYGEAFDDNQTAVWTKYKAAYDRYQERKAAAKRAHDSGIQRNN